MRVRAGPFTAFLREADRAGPAGKHTLGMVVRPAAPRRRAVQTATCRSAGSGPPCPPGTGDAESAGPGPLGTTPGSNALSEI